MLDEQEEIDAESDRDVEVEEELEQVVVFISNSNIHYPFCSHFLKNLAALVCGQNGSALRVIATRSRDFDDFVI